MLRTKNKLFIIFGLVAAGFLFSVPAQAVCPVCTIAVGAGVGLARYLGVEDTITGVWIGGLVISMALWTVSYLERKKRNIKNAEIISVVFYYLIVVVPLYFMGIMGHPFNKICGVDKLLVGIIFGSLAFILGHKINLKLKERNGGKVYFPFQKVAMGVASLIIVSLIFYIISKLAHRNK